MKKIIRIGLIFALLAAFRAYAQAPLKEWDKTIGGSSYDYAQSTIATNDGGFLIAGYSFSGISGDKTEAGKGFIDYWIIKLNSSGQKVWDKTIGGNFNDKAYSIVATTDGGCVIAGFSDYSGISGDKTEASKGLDDYWIVKLNSSGQKVWDKTIGGAGYDDAYSIVATTDGGYVIAGYSTSGISGDKTEESQGGYDYWIVKLNSSGQKVWDKTIGGSDYDLASSIVATTDGGFVVAGDSHSGISGDRTEASKGGDDFWIVKLNSSGQKVWDRTIGGGGNDYPYSIVATTDGGYVIAGASNSGISGDKTEASKGGNFDYWIVKLNSSGQKVWDKTIGGAGTDVSYSILATTDGGFVVAGYSFSDISGDKTEANRGASSTVDVWIVKLNSFGQKVWDKTIGGSADDEALSLVATTDGGFVVAGISMSGITCDKTEANQGSWDDWIVKFSPCPNTLKPTCTITTNQKAATTVITVAGTTAGGTLNTISSGSNVIYQGGNYVQLNAGFKANSGSVFVAKILAGCQ